MGALTELAAALDAFIPAAEAAREEACRRDSEVLEDRYHKTWDGNFTVYSNWPIFLVGISAGGKSGPRDRFGDGTFYDGD